MKQFKSPKIKCLNCKQIIYSKYSGEYVVCSCRIKANELESAIMATIEAYLPELFEGQNVSKTSHLLRCALSKHLNKGIMLDATPDYYRTSGEYELVEQGNYEDDQQSQERN